MRCSPSLFFRRGSDKGFGFSRLVPSKDAGEAVPLIALVCSGTFIIIVRVLAVSLSLSLSLSLSFVSFFFFRDTLFFFRRENAFFDTTRREVPFPRALERCHQGGGSSFREREREMRLCLCLSPFLCRVFASFLNKKKYFLLSVSIIHRPGVLVGATFMSRQILHSPGFYASREERQRGIDEPVQEKRVRGQKWYKHRVRRYFEERNKTKAPGELLPWLNAMFAPIHQPYDDVVGRKRT